MSATPTVQLPSILALLAVVCLLLVTMALPRDVEARIQQHNAYAQVVQPQTVGMATVEMGDFVLSCPASMEEGQSYSCTLTNDRSDDLQWPTVGLLHSSSDSHRALVAGSPVDVRFGSPLTASDVVTSNWWAGDVLLGFSRFNWPGSAT